MTFKQLLAHLQTMDETQLNSDVTVYNTSDDEFFKVDDIDYSPENDVLDKNHPFLVFSPEK